MRREYRYLGTRLNGPRQFQHTSFVTRIPISVNKRDGYRLRALVAKVGDGGADCRFIERDQYVAVGIKAFGNFYHPLARY